MHKLVRNILVAVITPCLVACVVHAADNASPKPPKGSMAGQLMLKYRLAGKLPAGSLEASVNHNRQEWDSLSPDQRDHYRQEALAFMDKSQEEQEALLKKYESLIKMDAQKQQAYRERARWLKIVVDSFTPQERENLQKMSPDERAKILLDRKAHLISEGKLAPAAPGPSTQPSTQPAE
jgi:hypothetical protein